MDAGQLLAGGYGILASGPLPVVEVYDRVVREFGYETNVVVHPTQERGGAPQVLTLDENYVIGRSFKARQLK